MHQSDATYSGLVSCLLHLFVRKASRILKITPAEPLITLGRAGFVQTQLPLPQATQTKHQAEMIDVIAMTL